MEKEGNVVKQAREVYVTFKHRYTNALAKPLRYFTFCYPSHSLLGIIPTGNDVVQSLYENSNQFPLLYFLKTFVEAALEGISKWKRQIGIIGRHNCNRYPIFMNSSLPSLKTSQILQNTRRGGESTDVRKTWEVSYMHLIANQDYCF